MADAELYLDLDSSGPSAGSAPIFTDAERAAFGAEIAERSARERRLAELRAARDRRGGAMSAAERVRRHVASTNEIGYLDAVADIAERESCRYDLPKYIMRYGAALLKDHFPSPLMIERFVKPLQESILNGGQLLVEIPRGKGKTTIIDLAASWCIAFGHRHYLVLISATGKLAKVNLKNIMKVILSPAFAADFPHISTPFLALGGKWQLCESQTFNGVSTGIETKTDHITFPTLLDKDGKPIGDAAGSVIFSAGVGGAIRGLNEGGLRPDLVFFDDIQKRKDAKSPALSLALEEFVNQDAMGLFGHGDTKTAIMAITPICEGDFASLMTDKERNPGWISVVIPLVIEWPANMDLVDRFFAIFKEDCARDDFSRTASKRFYIENREELNRGCVLLDPFDGGPGEVDALHHVLIIVANIGRVAFDAEYQMRVREEGLMLTVTPDLIKHALNGVPRLVLPPGTDTVVGFCDVNAKAESGLRYGLLALGANRVTGFIELSKYPKGRTPLFAETLPSDKRPEAIAQAVRFVGNLIAKLPIKFANGAPATVTAFAFDGGNWTAAVARAVLILRKVDRVPYAVFWTLGRAWSAFGKISRAKVIRRGDHAYETKSLNGKHVVFHSDFWREEMQSLFLSEPLTPGSCSLWGSDPFVHDEFATEVCSERLVRKFVRPDGQLEWDWSLKSKKNHYCDVASGCLVVASWVRAYEPVEKLIDRGALRGNSAAVTASVSADRAAMEKELAAYVAAHPEVEQPTAAELGTVTARPAVGLARKRKAKFHYGLRRR